MLVIIFWIVAKDWITKCSTCSSWSIIELFCRMELIPLVHKHVSKLCMHVTPQTNVLRRIVKYLTPECKIIMYTAFIALNFNYCHIVWYFCCHTNNLKIEKLHKKSLNVVLNNYLSPYHVLLEKVKRPTMYQGWNQSALKFLNACTIAVQAISLICFVFLPQCMTHEAEIN